MSQFLTTRELAAMLRVKERKVYELAAEGALPVRRVTGKLLFPPTGCGFFFFWRGKSSARRPGSKKCNVNEVIFIDFASRPSILLLNGRAKSKCSRPLVNPQQPRN